MHIFKVLLIRTLFTEFISPYKPKLLTLHLGLLLKPYATQISKKIVRPLVLGEDHVEKEDKLLNDVSVTLQYTIPKVCLATESACLVVIFTLNPLQIPQEFKETK